MEMTESGSFHAAGNLHTDEEFPFLPCWTKAEPFAYNRLPPDGASFRLLRMKTTDDVLSLPRISCSIHCMRLDNPRRPNYTTLSYAWGESFPDESHLTETLPCDAAYLRITKNLRSALVSIFENLGNDLIFLWVDAICINQADTGERNDQVTLMPEIYSNCTDMIIWLGELSIEANDWLFNLSSRYPGILQKAWPTYASTVPAHSWSDSYERLLKLLGESNHKLSKPRRLLLQTPPIELETAWLANLMTFIETNEVSRLREAAPNRPNDSQSEHAHALQSCNIEDESRRVNDQSFRTFMERAWFHRKWVLQEVALTLGKRRTFLIGDHVRTFSEIYEVVGGSSANVETTPLHVTDSNRNLLENLIQYQHSRCSEPRDHIYALLGISSDASAFRLDYSREIEELYQSVAEHYMPTDLVVVMVLATFQKQFGCLPSWVPDWRADWRRPLKRSKPGTGRHGRLLHMLNSETYTPSDLRLALSESGYSRNGGQVVVRAWIVPRCTLACDHFHDLCSMCRLSRPLSEEYFASRGQDTPAMMAHRKAQKKGTATIQDEFEKAMHSDEVICLLKSSIVAFVMTPVRSSLGLPAYRLEYCFEVTIPKMWPSRTSWFEDVLTEDEWQDIHIV